jgi:molybdopterin-guanine dinucleotide biosynthesis protein A
MGTPKAALEWHGSTLLRHVTGVVQRAVDGPVFVVRAPGQELPELDREIVVRDDPREGLGPMQGLAVGLRAAAEHPARPDVAFVCSTDLPFLHTAFVRAVLAGFASGPEPETGPETETESEVDAVLPIVRGFRQPLTAGYRTALAPLVEELLGEGRLRPAHLLAECRVRVLDEAALLTDRDLAAADPELESVVNVNEPDDYAAARRRPEPEVVVERYGVLATRGGERGPRVVRAATIGHAADLVGLAFDGHILAAVNGDQIRSDGTLPLQAGDTVSFISADAGG